MEVLLGKLAASLGLLVGLNLIFLLRPPRTWPSIVHRRVSWTALICSRCGLFLLLFVLLDRGTPSDVASYYVPQGKAALAGGLVYKDFPSSYGPLFPYAVAAVLSVVDSGKAIVLASILGEFLSFHVWGKVLRASSVSRGSVQEAEIMYVLCPVALLNVAMGGQQQAWLSALLGLSVLYIFRASLVVSGLTLGFNLLATKALAGFYFLPLCVMAGGKEAWRMACGTAALLGPVVLALVLFDANPLAILQLEATKISGGNLPFLLYAGTGLATPAWVPVLVVSLILTLLYRRHRRDWHRRSLRWMVAASLVFLLVSQKSFSGYFIFTALPLFALLPVTSMSLLFLSIFQLALALENSMHFRWFNGSLTRLTMGDPHSMLFFLTDLVVVSGYTWMLSQILRQTEQPPDFSLD